jgi:hypothetical protein
MHDQKMWPLRTALAWLASDGDEQFTQEIHDAEHDPDICRRLEDAMLQAGCVIRKARKVRVQLNKNDPAKADTWLDKKGVEWLKSAEELLKPDYQGRFQSLAEDYDVAKRKRSKAAKQDGLKDGLPLSLYGFLFERWRAARKKTRRRLGCARENRNGG